MPNENNKMQVDIDTLKKQNVNDLISIKELYSKLKEMENKISQVKYIDSNLANKLKKEYENLKKIILDENIQIKITNDINKITKDIEEIKENLTTTMNINRSEILKNNKLQLIDGVETETNNQWYTSSFIDISDGANIVGNATRKVDAIAFYDENKNYVTSIKPSIPTTSNSIFKAETITKKGQYKYCRVVSVIYSLDRQFVGSVGTFTHYTNVIKNLDERLTFLENKKSDIIFSENSNENSNNLLNKN